MLKLAFAFAILASSALAVEPKTFTLALNEGDIQAIGAALQHVPDKVPVTLTVTEAGLQAIGTGLQELPYKTAAPLLLKLRDQIEAQTAPKSAPPAKH